MNDPAVLPPVGPPIVTTGGAAGSSAITEDLDRVARTIGEASHLVEQCAWAVEETRRCAYEARVASRDDVAAAIIRAEEALTEVAQGAGGHRALAGTLRDMGDRVSAVARAYLEAEEGARQRVGAGARWWRGVRDGFAAATWVPRTAASLVWKASQPAGILRAVDADVVGERLDPGGPPPTTSALRRDTVRGALSLADAPRGPLPTHLDGMMAVVAGAIANLDAWLGEPRPVGVLLLGEPQDYRPPAGVADLIGGIGKVPDAEFGAVAIDTVTGHDGSRSYIVTVPGTQEWGLGQPHVKDLDGNLRGVLGAQSDAARLTLDAMAAHGIPADAPVMLVGHSQGGIVVSGIAAAAGVERHYRLTHVVTAASPVGRLEHPDRTQYLHLSHAEDMVPGLDGVAPPDAPHVVSVSGELRASADVALAATGESIGGAHKIPSYVATAQAVDTNPSLSLAAWREGARTHMSGASAERSVYTTSALPPPRSTEMP